MANTSSAKKAAKQSEKRRVINLTRKTALKTAVKKVIVAIEAKDFDAQAATGLLKDAAAKLARAKGKGVIHRNTAARRLSRLQKRLNKKAETAGA